jgi:hypothetical protein
LLRLPFHELFQLNLSIVGGFSRCTDLLQWMCAPWHVAVDFIYLLFRRHVVVNAAPHGDALARVERQRGLGISERHRLVSDYAMASGLRIFSNGAGRHWPFLHRLRISVP